jgi:hypothetical protein
MPDVEIKPQKYKDPRPPEHFEPFHARVRAREPEAHVYEIVRIVTVLHALIRVTVSYGMPLRFAAIASPTREQPQEAADLILDRIRAQHGQLVRRGHRASRRAERPTALA